MRSSTPNILLVNPWIHDFAAYDLWAKPLGLLTLAGILRAHGFRVAVIDCLDRFHPRAPRPSRAARFGCGPFHKRRLPKPAPLADVPRHFSRYGIEPEWLREDLRGVAPPDLILVTSGMTYWYTGVQETIALIREVFPDPPVVLGGIYATLWPEHARRMSGADEVVTGPGEAAVFDVTARYTGYQAPAHFSHDALDTYPLPALDLQRRLTCIPLLTQRGCPYACAYCASQRLQPRRLRRSPAAVVGELTHWHRRHAAIDVALYDDAFLADPDGHGLPILEAIVRAGLPLRFHTPNALHIRGITTATAALLFKAGFQTLRLGLEAVEVDQPRTIDHKVTAAEFTRAARILLKAGFNRRQLGAYLLAGLPGQSTAEVLRSIDAVRAAGVTPIVATYSPIPGTALWPQAVAASRYDLAAEPLCTNNSVFPCRREPFNWEWMDALRQRVGQGPH